jgi:hypothetical protein
MEAEASRMQVRADNIVQGSIRASTGQLCIAVGIATAGRREILAHTLDLIAQQTRLPDSLVVCPAVAEDMDAMSLERLPFSSVVRVGRRGLTAQRNQILSAAGNADVVVFFRR